MKNNFIIMVLAFFIALDNSVECKSLKHILNSGKFPEVESNYLDLSNLGLTDIKGIGKYPGIENVQVLILRDNKLQSIEALKEIYGIDLQALDISSNKISDIAVLGKFKKLRALFMEGNKIDGVSLKKLLDTLPLLENLHVDDNPVKDPVYKYNFQTTGAARNANYLQVFPYVAEDQIGAVIVQEVESKVVADKCSICIDDEDDSELVALECFHIFHRNCIGKWIQSQEKAKCPMCKKQLE